MGSYDKAAMTKEDLGRIADVMINHGGFVREPPGGIFEDFVFGEIRVQLDPADQPDVADFAKAFAISAGTVQYTGINYATHEETYTDAPVYHASSWARTDDNGHRVVTFVIGNVHEGNTYVLVEFAAVEWPQGTNLKIVEPHRRFMKTKGAQFLQFDVIRE